MSDANSSAPRARLLWLAPLLLAPALILGAAGAPFSSHDDDLFIVGNPHVQAGSSWADAWAPDEGQFFYHPLTVWSWRVDRVVWGTLLEPALGDRAWPAGVRLGNLLLHLLAALAVWRIARALGAGGPLAGFAAAAFALHPSACESVAWAVERKTVLAGALALWAIDAHVRAKGAKGRASAVALYALALLSKPSALGAFPVVAAWELLGRPRIAGAEADAPSPATRLRALAPWAVLSLLGAWLGLRMVRAAVMKPPGGSVGSALLVDVVILGRYVANFAWPCGSSAYYDVRPAVALADPELLASAASLGLVLLASVLAVHSSSRRIALFAWLWFLGALGPNLNLVGISDLMHDRYAYLSAPGFWLAIGLAAQGAWRRLVPRSTATRWLAPVAVAALSILWAAASAKRSALFASTELLFEDAAARAPGSAYARIALSKELRAKAARLGRAGGDDEARELSRRQIEELEAGIAAPDFGRYLFQVHARAALGLAYFESGRMELAEREMEAALRAPRGYGFDPADLAGAEQVLGVIARRRGDPGRALEHFDRALRHAPAQRSIELHRAKALLDLGRREMAVNALGRIGPDDPAHAEASNLLRNLAAPR